MHRCLSLLFDYYYYVVKGIEYSLRIANYDPVCNVCVICVCVCICMYMNCLIFYNKDIFSFQLNLESWVRKTALVQNLVKSLRMKLDYLMHNIRANMLKKYCQNIGQNDILKNTIKQIPEKQWKLCVITWGMFYTIESLADYLS